MKIVKNALFMPALFLLALGFIMGEAMEARALSQKIAPDVSPEILEKLLPDAKIYMTGSGSKEVLLLADPFCENSRNTYRLLQTRLEQIRTVRILWVSAFPEKGSEIAAAAAMKMQASGKGESAQAIPGEANFVSREQADLVKLLAPPPSDHSPRTQAEILELIQIQKMRTPQEKTLAAADDRISVFRFASALLGPQFTLENLPLTEELFRRLTKDAISVFSDSKEKWNRTRPFVVNTEVKACSEHASSGAYPSGHSICGYLTAIVLADMIPEKKTELFERAAQYAGNRMVCGVHYRSDIEAGQIGGTVIAAFAMQNPRFRKEFEEARKEVRKILGLP